jgi:hypothetical protein
LLFLFSRAVLNTIPVCRHAAVDLGLQDAKRLSGGKFGWCEKTEVTPLRWSPEALRPAGGARSNSATAVTPGAHFHQGVVHAWLRGSVPLGQLRQLRRLTRP